MKEKESTLGEFQASLSRVEGALCKAKESLKIANKIMDDIEANLLSIFINSSKQFIENLGSLIFLIESNHKKVFIV